MNIEKKIQGTTTTFWLEGKIDTLTTTELTVAIESIIQDTEHLILDFEKVTYISSAGLRSLLVGHQKMQEKNGKMEIVHIGDAVMAVFIMTGFDKILLLG
ncbi:MAG: STAS domain-containing protein [Eubacterium sp.]